MALATTTLSAAITATQTSFVVASAASVAPGRLLRVDDEWMQVAQNYSSGTTIYVLRGRDGSVATAHPVTANVCHGNAADFQVPPPATSEGVTYPRQSALRTTSYTTSATAITFGAGIEIAILNGTSVLAQTVAHPTKDLDGCILIVVGNGKAAHTLTFPTGGIGNAGAGYTVLTFDGSGACCVQLIACNGFWVPLPSTWSGTLSNIDVAIS